MGKSCSRDNSLFWGISQPLNISSGVNPRDREYQEAYKAFRDRLIRARKEAGMTQRQVSAKMGKSNSFISKCELGERRVDYVELQKLAVIYRKSISFFNLPPK
jgi:ribosome-binding protein aMBF1 (putative translation factor)